MDSKEGFFSQPVTSLSGIGGVTAEKLHILGIYTILDLLNHFPRRHFMLGDPKPISEITPDTLVSVLGHIGSPKTNYTKSGKLMTTATVAQGVHKLQLMWFNSPYVQRSIDPDQEYLIAGKTSSFAGRLTIISPTIEKSDQSPIHTTGFVPIYPQTQGITSKWLRQKIHWILQNEPISDWIDTAKLPIHLPDLSTAYHQIHFPLSTKSRDQADRRLSFDTLYRINIELIKNRVIGKRAIALHSSPSVIKSVQARFPYDLTPSQMSTISKAGKYLAEETPHQFLLQGETGSGKTAVIASLCLQYLSQGQSSLILAPTEILANQHYQTISELCKSNEVHLFTSQSHPEIGDTPGIFVGTHSLITSFKSQPTIPIALVCIDEQHKFGVKQKDHFLEFSPTPHILHLSATPIPRTVALGMLGEVHTLNLKKDRPDTHIVKTYIIDTDKFQDSWSWLKSELNKSQKVLVVAPRISSTDLEDTNLDHKAVLSLHRLYTKHLPEFPVFLLHGQLDKQTQAQVISDFRSAPAGVLVATTIIEVGIDIPSANIIMIHEANQYGLAQLHQLRGRVGRHSGQGHCFLISSDTEDNPRLTLLKKYHTGAKLSRADLKLRGAGEVFGLKQHGLFNTRLKYFWSKTLFLTAKKIALQYMLEQSAKVLVK